MRILWILILNTDLDNIGIIPLADLGPGPVRGLAGHEELLPGNTQLGKALSLVQNCNFFIIFTSAGQYLAFDCLSYILSYYAKSILKSSIFYRYVIAPCRIWAAFSFGSKQNLKTS